MDIIIKRNDSQEMSIQAVICCPFFRNMRTSYSSQINFLTFTLLLNVEILDLADEIT